MNWNSWWTPYRDLHKAPCDCEYCKASRWRRFVSGTLRILTRLSIFTGIAGITVLFVVAGVVEAHTCQQDRVNERKETDRICHDTVDVTTGHVFCPPSATIEAQPIGNYDAVLVRCHCPSKTAPAASVTP